MIETPIEKRKKIISKRLNRDDLLRVLGNVITDKDCLNTIRNEIMDTFSKNREKEMQDEEYISAKVKYIQYKKQEKENTPKITELNKDIESKEQTLSQVDEKIVNIDVAADKLEDGGLFLKRMKLEKMEKERDYLVKQQRQINKEIRNLQDNRDKLQALIDSYGPKIERPTLKEVRAKRKKIGEYEGDSTIKLYTGKIYRKKYFEMIEHKKAYMEDLLKGIGNIDLGISGTEQQEIIEKIRQAMQKTIDEMEKGDDLVKIVNNSEKWLEENWETKIKKYNELKKDIKIINDDITTYESKLKMKDLSFDDIASFQQKLIDLRTLSSSKNEELTDLIKEINGYLKIYNNTEIDGTETLYVQPRSRYVMIDEFKKEAEIDDWCNDFLDNIKKVKSPKNMVELFKNLIKENKLEIIEDSTGRFINLDCLSYEIKVLDIYNYKKEILVAEDETNKEGMMQISDNCDAGWDVATQTDIQNILKELTTQYPIYMQAGKISEEFNDEDIAFFMLITQCMKNGPREFLLKDNNVLKCYRDFRGFRKMKDNGTGGIILVRKKQK